jgi:hypothetical protein
MAVFLRWLLVDFIVIRVLRHRLLRRRASHAYTLVSRQGDPALGRAWPTPGSGTYHYVRRRRLSCCSGCLVLIAVMTLGIVLLTALVHWAW